MFPTESAPAWSVSGEAVAEVDADAAELGAEGGEDGEVGGFVVEVVAAAVAEQTSSLQSMRVAYPDQSSNPVCGFSMMERVRLCTVCPMENWCGTSKTTYRVG